MANIQKLAWTSHTYEEDGHIFAYAFWDGVEYDYHSKTGELVLCMEADGEETHRESVADFDAAKERAEWWTKIVWEWIPADDEKQWVGVWVSRRVITPDRGNLLDLLFAIWKTPNRWDCIGLVKCREVLARHGVTDPESLNFVYPMRDAFDDDVCDELWATVWQIVDANPGFDVDEQIAEVLREQRRLMGDDDNN